MTKILIIEDEEPISDLLKMNLNFAGYETYQSFDGEIGLESVNKNDVDLVILDIMLPKIDGYELLPKIIKKGIPVILLTAKDDLKNRVRGLNMGADDYIVKPFETLELLARVNTVLRRTSKKQSTFEFDNIILDIDKKTVSKDGNEIIVTFKEFELLKTLIENKGIVMSREKLLQIVWGYDFEGDTRTVDMHIQKLRKKLSTDKIKTLFKSGYRLDV